MARRKVLITGMPRSGTGYASTALTNLGMRCGHEQCATPSGWDGWKLFEAESSWLIPSISGVPRDGILVCQIRNPLLTIRSLLSLSTVAGRPEFARYRRGADAITEACEAYIDWYRRIMEMGPDLVHRIEAPEWERILDLAGHRIPEGATIDSAPLKWNTRPRTHDTLAWDHLTPEVRSFAEMFGYDVTSTTPREDRIDA